MVGQEASRERLAVVTGTGGLGLECARAFVNAEIRVILAGRNSEKGKDAIFALTRANANARARFEQVDLSSLQSVKSFVARMQTRGEQIDLLINNAGIMSPPRRETTAEGFELQFGVNYLSHFALTAGLLPLLRGGARVVSVTSLAQHYAKLNLDSLQSAARYSPGGAYCVSKLLQSMFAVELQRRSERMGWGIISTAAHPGFAATNLFQGGQGRIGLRSFISTRVIAPLIGHSATAGAAPIVHAALSPHALGGRLYGPKGFKEMKGPPGECRFAEPVYNAELCSRLWMMSEEMTGFAL